VRDDHDRQGYAYDRRVLVAAPPPPTIVIGRSIGGIELRMTEATVRARLGAPVRIRGRLLHFPLLDVVLRDGRVASVSTRSTRFRTRQGYGVGVPVARIQHLSGLFCDLEPGGGTCTTRGIAFEFARQRVTQVTVP
jgi:hypothetical protein